MLIHSVYFSLRPDLTASELALYDQRLASLLTIDGIVHGWTGVPAATDRAVIDRNYSRALIIVFTDAAAEAAYQVDPIHDVFRDECHTFWTQVRIFDAET
jgi:hypothetical protein